MLFLAIFEHNSSMIIFYILLIAYILAVNFYAFLLVKSLRDKERQNEIDKQARPLSDASPTNPENKQPERCFGKLCITGLLGGAITIYVCMFIFKYKLSELLLMVLMPLFGVLNIYFCVLLIRSGFSVFLIR